MKKTNSRWAISLCLISILLFCTNCSDEQNNTTPPASISIMIVDTNGQNLLEPTAANCIISPNTTITMNGKDIQKISIQDPDALSHSGAKFYYCWCNERMYLSIGSFFGSKKNEVATIDWGNGMEKDVITFSYHYGSITNISINGEKLQWVDENNSHGHHIYKKNIP